MSKATIKLDGKPIRILLGKEASCILVEEGMPSFVKYCKNDGCYEICTIKDGMDLFSILSSFDGWDDYVILTEKEYQKIIKL
jgi:hypothetical protein